MKGQPCCTLIQGGGVEVRTLYLGQLTSSTFALYFVADFHVGRIVMSMKSIYMLKIADC